MSYSLEAKGIYTKVAEQYHRK